MVYCVIFLVDFFFHNCRTYNTFVVMRFQIERSYVLTYKCWMHCKKLFRHSFPIASEHDSHRSLLSILNFQVKKIRRPKLKQVKENDNKFASRCITNYETHKRSEYTYNDSIHVLCCIKHINMYDL